MLFLPLVKIYLKLETLILTSPSSLHQVVVRCKSSYTGLFSFLAIPLLMGDVMITFMQMIDINIDITITTAATEATTTVEPNNNNNNNNNNNGAAAPAPAPATG